MIQEDYVNFECAKLLKEKGFDIPTRFVWYERLPASIGCDNSKIGKNCMELFYYNSTTQFEQHFINNRGIPDYIQGEVYSAPTLQVTMKWLREVHNLSVEVYRTACGYISCIVSIPSGTDIKFLEDDGDDLPSGQYTTWEKACEATIKYCLENLI